MPKLFARQTALSNVGGRIDYISNPKRQENLLAVHDGADAAYWQQLARECSLASKHKSPGTKTVQGRELMFQLSNSLLQRLTPEEIAKEISRSFEERYGRPCMVAVHFNKGKKSLHAHIVYSERELLKEPKEKVAPRALFFDEHGVRQYKKADILDENGELRPKCKIVKKGDVYERRLFGPVDPQFSSKAWLKECKSTWLLPLRNGTLKGDVEIREFDHSSGELPQQYIGDKIEHGAPELAAEIQKLNDAIKEYNAAVMDGVIPREDALSNKKVFFKSPYKLRIQALKPIIEAVREFLGIKSATKSGLPEPEKKPSLADRIFSAAKHSGQTGTSEQEPEQER